MSQQHSRNHTPEALAEDLAGCRTCRDVCTDAGRRQGRKLDGGGLGE